MLNWVNRFNIFCLLDNAHYNLNTPAFECLLAAGSKAGIDTHQGQAFSQLQDFYTHHKHEWIFGHLGYDLKNEIENLGSRNADHVGFSDLHFFVPQIVLELNNNEVKIYADADPGIIYEEIRRSPAQIRSTDKTTVEIRNRIPRNDYLAIIEKLKQHILRGDCYEINYCQEFYATNALIDPLYIYNRLTELSPNPFSVLYKVNSRYCLCASPERYLKKSGNKIFSQPIKGTAKRNLVNKAEDDLAGRALLKSEKEKSENVMVVDLVRNDLSRICKAGSVKVDELFGLYSFPQVHQLISTVSGELEEALNWIDCIRATFPMGSMTGAPKKRVMELIEEYEQTGRGLFSGAIGYVKPGDDLPDGQADFDFNVVIRSILYNAETKYLSFQTGGAITYKSNAEMEYEECLLKAAAIIKVLE